MHHAHRGLGIVAVHVEDRRLHHLRDVGGVHARAAEVGRGREPELVVHDDVHGAADLVAGHFGEVEGLGDDALARERGVAVHEHGQHGVAALVVLGVADGAGDAFDDRADGLEMAGIGGEREVDLGAAPATGACRSRRGGTSRRPSPARSTGSSSPSNSRKICSYDLPSTFASALRRPRWVMPNTTSVIPESAASLHSASSIGTSVSAPSRLKRFCPRYLVCRKRSNASAAFSRSRIRRFSSGVTTGGDAFDPLLDPLLLIGLLDVHVLDADRARVRVAQHAEDVAERHHATGRRPAPRFPTGNSRSRSQIERS